MAEVHSGQDYVLCSGWATLDVARAESPRRVAHLVIDSLFGWCDVVTPEAQFCDQFGPVVRLVRLSRRYEGPCLRTNVSYSTTRLKHAIERIHICWNLNCHLALSETA